MESSIKTHLEYLARTARDCGVAVYAVGGCLRDHLLNRPCCDFDFTCKDALLLAKQFSEEYRFKKILLDDTRGRETIRIVFNENSHLDISQLQGHTIEQDLKRRDFTINALAQTLENFIAGNGEIIDPLLGKSDLAHKCIRMVSDDALREDPLRLLRGIRFAASLKFQIHPNTLEAIESNATLVAGVAGERIHHELTLLLDTPHLPMKELWESDLLQAIFPETKTNLEKTQSVLAEIEQLLETSSANDAIHQESHRFLLRLAGILYPLDRTQAEESASKTFRKNTPIVKRLKALKFSNEEIKLIDRSLFFTQRVLQCLTKHSDSALSSETQYQLVKDWEGEEWIVLSLTRCLQRAIGGRTIDNNLQALQNFYHQQYLPEKNKPSFFDGNILSSRLHLKPSPDFKMILEQIEEARILGRISNADEAEQLARDLIQSNRNTE